MNEIRLRKKFSRVSLTLLAAGILISLLPFLPVTVFLSKTNIQHYLVPLLWSILCGVMLLFIPRIHSLGKVEKQDSILFDAIICATILLGCRLGAGFLIDGFGKSPYDLSLSGIQENLFLIVPELIGKELLRSYFLCTFCRKNNYKGFIFITLLFTISNLNIRAVFAISSTEKLVSYLAQYFGPELSKNVVLSYFALYGGPVAAITYAGILAGFMQFFPILPTLKWITEGVVSISVPIIEAYAISGKYSKLRQYKWVPRETFAGLAGWTVTLAASVAFLWFVVGVFPIYPSVIATGSMKPLINEGDVILIQRAVKEEDIYNLKKGDIIQFTRDDMLITHRILTVIEDENGNLSFQTKGDNNTAEDTRLVLPNEIRGTLVRVIPKVGIPTLWIKSREREQPEGVEF